VLESAVSVTRGRARRGAPEQRHCCEDGSSLINQALVELAGYAFGDRRRVGYTIPDGHGCHLRRAAWMPDQGRQGALEVVFQREVES
jgi:hypothetical protein